jgi:hypothetical protein
VAGATEQVRELEPAPGAVAGAVHEDEVLLVGLVNLAAGLQLTCSFVYKVRLRSCVSMRMHCCVYMHAYIRP